MSNGQYPTRGSDILTSSYSAPSPQPPDHLSEFYSFVGPATPDLSRSGPKSSPPTRGTPIQERRNGHFRTDSASSWAIGSIFRKSSIASINTTRSTIASTSFGNVANNHPDLPALITSNEINATTNSYRHLLDAAAGYREALMSASKAAAEFGAALEACSRCKGAGNSSEGLQAAGGLHYLVSNHQQILAKSIHSAFEIPVKTQLETFKYVTNENERKFKIELREKSRLLKKREAENQKMAQRRVRNLAEYRNALLELTSQIDDIDRLKYSYFQSAYDLAESTSGEILSHAASIVRAQLEIYEGIARKGWSGGGLEDLIATCPDPFTNEEDDKNTMTTAKISKKSTKSSHHDIFSILPTSSILPRPRAKDDEIDTLRERDEEINDASDIEDEQIEDPPNDSFYTEPLPNHNIDKNVSIEEGEEEEEQHDPNTPIVHPQRSFSDDMIGYSGWNSIATDLIRNEPDSKEATMLKDAKGVGDGNRLRESNGFEKDTNSF
jgi:hypothetical protein